jgi:two-component sensor histidine kinase
MIGRFTDSQVNLGGVMLDAHASLLAEGEAVAVALILNELMSNAVKHSGVAAQQTVIWIQAAQDAEHVQVRVRNRGRLPDGFDFASGRGLGTGLSLVRSLVPAAGMDLAFIQDGEAVEVRIDFSPPVLASVTPRAVSTEG